jgi:hypothetical protein
MDRRTALSVLFALPFVLVLVMGCEGQGSSAPERAQLTSEKEPAGSVQEVILRIEGMT